MSQREAPVRVRFTADYDHRWPSRAMTAFKAGWEGLVKFEVWEAAKAKGRATLMSERAKPAGDGKPGRMGRSDHGADAPARNRRNRRAAQPDPTGPHSAYARFRGDDS